MNTNTIEQPITQNDVQAVLSAMNSNTGDDAAKIGLLKMVVTVAMQSDTLKISSNEIFSALAAGSTVAEDEALYSALALETSLVGSVGAVIIQGAGIIQIISWAKSAESWIASKLSMITTILTPMLSGSIGSVVSSISSVFGIGQQVKKDASSTLQLFTLLSGNAAPALSATLVALGSKTGTSSKGGGGGGGGQSSSGSSSSGSGSSSNSSSGGGSSSGGTSSSNDSSKRKKKRDMSSVAIRSRRSLMKTR